MTTDDQGKRERKDQYAVRNKTPCSTECIDTEIIIDLSVGLINCYF